MVHLTKLLRWVLGLAAVILRTPLIDFEVNIADPAFARTVAEAIKDGELTDEELASLLDLISQELSMKRKDT